MRRNATRRDQNLQSGCREADSLEKGTGVGLDNGDPGRWDFRVGGTEDIDADVDAVKEVVQGSLDKSEQSSKGQMGGVYVLHAPASLLLHLKGQTLKMSDMNANSSKQSVAMSSPDAFPMFRAEAMIMEKALKEDLKALMMS